eukprot:10510572-Heterocapsa_arctica.AAC.1
MHRRGSPTTTHHGLHQHLQGIRHHYQQGPTYRTHQWGHPRRHHGRPHATTNYQSNPNMTAQ